MDRPRLEVGIYQIADDGLMAANRRDGTGWVWSWADWRRGWMDDTPSRYAYRCLPLTIANQLGWWVGNPVGFTAVWHGSDAPGSIEFHFDTARETWAPLITSQFGQGIITWNTPFLIRTRPRGSRLLVCGPTNYFKPNLHPLTALIESDWLSASFTMNWKIMSQSPPVRFEVGEPLFQFIPLITNTAADLESASVYYQNLGDDEELANSYQLWHDSRRQFHDLKQQGEVLPNDWQKDYFQGRDVAGREADSEHMTKIRPPRVRRGPREPS
jgi:Family of unknown function (DUF6065)